MFVVGDVLVSIAAGTVAVGATGRARVAGPFVIRRVWRWVRRDLKTR